MAASCYLGRCVFPCVGCVVCFFDFGSEVGSACVFAEEDEVCSCCYAGFEGREVKEGFGVEGAGADVGEGWNLDVRI